MADLRNCRSWIRVRFLRAADAPDHRAPGAVGAAAGAAHESSSERVGRVHALYPCGGGGDLRAARRLPDRPARPTPGARVEHSAVCGLGPGGRLLDLGRMAAVLALLHVRRRLRRVCRGRRMARRAVHRSEATRIGHRIHAGVRVDRRDHGDRRVLLDRHLRRVAAAGARGTRSVALHVDVGSDSGNPPDRDQTLPARIAGLAREESRGHAQASELRRAVRLSIPADHRRDHDHDGMRVRGGLRRHSADAAHRARTSGRAWARAHRRGAGCERRPVLSRKSAGYSDGFCSRFSPPAS